MNFEINADTGNLVLTESEEGETADFELTDDGYMKLTLN